MIPSDKQYEIEKLLKQTDDYLDTFEKLNHAYPMFEPYICKLRQVKTHFIDIQLQQAEE